MHIKLVSQSIFYTGYCGEKLEVEQYEITNWERFLLFLYDSEKDSKNVSSSVQSINK